MAIRIGFLGVGGIAHTHLHALSQIEEATVVAFCDTDESRAQAAAARFQGRAYTDFEKMLKEEWLDALFVCLPPHAHVGQEELAAEKGLHLFIEKPVARTLERARAIEAAIQKAGIIASVGYHYRYYESTQRARERLQGLPIAMVVGYWNGGMPSVYWWRRHEMSGGQIIEQTTHIFDLARYLVGEIEEVYAYFAQRVMHQEVPETNVADVGVVALRFANGAVGTIMNTCLLQVPGKAGLEILTPQRMLEVSWGSLREVEPNRTEEYRSDENPYLNEDRIFLEAIQKGEASAIRSPYSDAVKTLAATLAADESARTGKPVRVEG